MKRLPGLPMLLLFVSSKASRRPRRPVYDHQPLLRRGAAALHRPKLGQGLDVAGHHTGGTEAVEGCRRAQEGEVGSRRQSGAAQLGSHEPRAHRLRLAQVTLAAAWAWPARMVVELVERHRQSIGIRKSILHALLLAVVDQGLGHPVGVTAQDAGGAEIERHLVEMADEGLAEIVGAVAEVSVKSK